MAGRPEANDQTRNTPERELWKCRGCGKRGKPKAGFPLFPQPLGNLAKDRRDSHISTAPTGSRRMEKQGRFSRVNRQGNGAEARDRRTRFETVRRLPLVGHRLRIRGANLLQKEAWLAEFRSSSRLIVRLEYAARLFPFASGTMAWGISIVRTWPRSTTFGMCLGLAPKRFPHGWRSRAGSYRASPVLSPDRPRRWGSRW